MNLGKTKTLQPRWYKKKKIQNLSWVLEFQVKTWLLAIFLFKSVLYFQ